MKKLSHQSKWLGAVYYGLRFVVALSKMFSKALESFSGEFGSLASRTYKRFYIS